MVLVCFGDVLPDFQPFQEFWLGADPKTDLRASEDDAAAEALQPAVAASRRATRMQAGSWRIWQKLILRWFEGKKQFDYSLYCINI